jgi:hypothetical protein
MKYFKNLIKNDRVAMAKRDWHNASLHSVLANCSLILYDKQCLKNIGEELLDTYKSSILRKTMFIVWPVKQPIEPAIMQETIMCSIPIENYNILIYLLLLCKRNHK